MFKGAVAAFTQGPCSDALEFQIHLKVRLPRAFSPTIHNIFSALHNMFRSDWPRTSLLWRRARSASCFSKVPAVACTAFFSALLSSSLPTAGEYAASARGQVHAPLLKHPQAAVGSQQDLEAMRLFLFDCSDGASVSSSSSSSKIMLRLRRSTSALAPDVSLGVISIFCSVAAPRLPAPVMDVDKASSCSQRQPTVP